MLVTSYTLTKSAHARGFIKSPKKLTARLCGTCEAWAIRQGYVIKASRGPLVKGKCQACLE